MSKKLFDIQNGKVVLDPTSLYKLDLKPIPGFSKYMITSDGRVWSNTRFVRHSMVKGATCLRKGKWLKSKIGNNGYFRIQLMNDTEGSSHRTIHRLVLMALDRTPIGNEHCDHINNNRQDNRIENLSWESAKYNSGRAHAKYYMITDSKGNDKLIFNLKQFCLDNKFNKGLLIATMYGGTPYKGMTIKEVKVNE